MLDNDDTAELSDDRAATKEPSDKLTDDQLAQTAGGHRILSPAAQANLRRTPAQRAEEQTRKDSNWDMRAFG